MNSHICNKCGAYVGKNLKFSECSYCKTETKTETKVEEPVEEKKSLIDEISEYV